jgi:hypothetical protein
VSSQWWFDDSYLNRPLTPIKQYFALLLEYQELPRTRGTGHLIQAWIRNHDLESASVRASAAISELINDL